NVHLWAAQWLLQECRLLPESRQHLAAALGYEPEFTWLSTMVWNCLRVLLARGEGAEAVDWLDWLTSRGVRVVGADYAKAIALFQMGPLGNAAEAGAAVRHEPHPKALLQLVPELIRALDAAGRPREAAECLDLLWRLAREAPRTYVGLGLVLA